MSSGNQYNWRWCSKCQGLVYGGDLAENLGPFGRCPAGNEHYLGASKVYSIGYGTPPTATSQQEWRWCEKCHGMCYAGGPEPGRCPAGGTHDHSPSLPYALLRDTAFDSGQQDNWRWCNKCQGLAYGGSPLPGPCPAGNEHYLKDSSNYILTHPMPTKPLAPADLTPRNGTSVSRDPYFTWRDPGAGTTAQAGLCYWIVSQGGVIVGPSVSAGETAPATVPPGARWLSTPLPLGSVTVSVWFLNAAGTGPESTTTFQVI
jgi:hypothetical protein